MMLDRTNFISQAGPYVMGENSAEISEHDRKVRANAWRVFSSSRMQHGEYGDILNHVARRACITVD